MVILLFLFLLSGCHFYLAYLGLCCYSKTFSLIKNFLLFSFQFYSVITASMENRNCCVLWIFNAEKVFRNKVTISIYPDYFKFLISKFSMVKTYGKNERLAQNTLDNYLQIFHISQAIFPNFGDFVQRN